MTEISTYKFNKDGVQEIRKNKYGSDWPVTYLIENKKTKHLYVGQTVRAYHRTKQHLENEKRKSLEDIHIISDNEFNVSAAFDIESSLIEYFVGDGVYTLQNGNGGLKNHDYFDREKYKAKFEEIWKVLQKMKIANKDTRQIRNSDLFKYSPYKSLTDDQYYVASELVEKITKRNKGIYIIKGGPGTGKTILASYLIKRLTEKDENGSIPVNSSQIGLVIAMTALRKTLQRVFRSIQGLKSTMVIGPGEVSKKKYTVLVVDEAHRLRRRKNITNYRSFDNMNRKLELEKEADELDWIINSADHVVLFYDEKQSIKPSDVRSHRFKNLEAEEFSLTSQMRVRGGDEYIRFIDNLLEVEIKEIFKISDYDFKIYRNISQMVSDIKKRDSKHQLARMVAGFAWPWKSKENKKVPDIKIEDVELFWNSTATDWVNSPNAINEVGCIHTIQGYDLNYAGVIMGPEITFNPVTKSIVIDLEKYFDVKGRSGVEDPEEIKRYIINIYKTILTRGILGTYVYICDKNLRDYFESNLKNLSIAKLKTED